MNYDEKKSEGLKKANINEKGAGTGWCPLLMGWGGVESHWGRGTATLPMAARAAWCSAVLPARSDTFTLLRRGTKASAHLTALLAAAVCKGVCQFFVSSVNICRMLQEHLNCFLKHMKI